MKDKLERLVVAGIARYFVMTRGTGKNVNEAEVIANYLLEKGVIVPPCKVGDTVYHITGIDTREDLDLTDIFEGKVCSISKDEKSLWIYARYDNGLTYWYAETDIGRKLFFTREEAEKTLAERESK